MTKQEEIREGLISKVKSIRLWAANTDNPMSIEEDADDILKTLHSQGLVLKVDLELSEEGLWVPGGWFMPKAACVALMDISVEPLIKVL